jgi:hypothetical protein
MSSGFVVGLLSYIPSNVRNFFVPPMPIPDVKNNKSKVQLSRLSHVYYQHSDLETFRRFAKDFGLVEVKDDGDTIYFRGYGIDQYVYVAQKGRPQFRGPVFVAASHEEFDKATKIPGASLHSLENAPGGGRMITFARPNGTFFHVLYGQEERIIDSRQPPSETHETQGPYNLPFEKPRLGEFTSKPAKYISANRILQDNFNDITPAQHLCTSLVILATFVRSLTQSWIFIPPTSTSSIRMCYITRLFHMSM